MKRKITTIFLAFIGICSLLCGCNNISDKDIENNDSNIEKNDNTSDQTQDFKTGVYYLDANVMKPCIVLTSDKMVFFTEKNLYYGKVYDYTKNQSTINAKNSYSEIVVSVSDDTLTYEGDVYTLKHENVWFSEEYSVEEVITDPYTYFYALTEEDYNTASKAATEYYNDRTFIQEVLSIELDDNIESYHSAAYISDNTRIAPGNIILLKVITTSISADDFTFEDHRYMTLIRTSKDSEWTVTNDGR